MAMLSKMKLLKYSNTYKSTYNYLYLNYYEFLIKNKGFKFIYNHILAVCNIAY